MSLTSDVEAHNAHLRKLAPHDPYSFPFVDIPPPAPDASCSISLIRTGYARGINPALLLLNADESEAQSTPMHCFLIEKQLSGQTVRLMFDLGIRNVNQHDNKRYIRLLLNWNAIFTPGAHGVLEENDIPLSSISAILLSHSHVDHIGNLAKFPESTSLVVGPESPTGEQLAQEMDVPLSVLESHTIRQLNRTEDKWVTVGSLQGMDYFGDGSLWLLDTPGHKRGHISALVCTSTNPPVYHLLGSDTCHHCTLLHSTQEPKPRAGLYTPDKFDPAVKSDKLRSMHEDLEEAYRSMAKVGRMDLENNINVFLAHDMTIDLMYPLDLHFIRMDGGVDELRRLKGRDRSASANLLEKTSVTSAEPPPTNNNWNCK